MKKLHLLQFIFTLLLIAAVVTLCYLNYRANQLLDIVGESLLLQTEIDQLKMEMRPCAGEGADVRTYEVRKR